MLSIYILRWKEMLMSDSKPRKEVTPSIPPVIHHLLPHYLVYFLIGFSAIDAVASTFFSKQHFTSLSSADLITLGIWVSLPWSMKVGIGAVIDLLSKYLTRGFWMLLGGILSVLSGLLYVHIYSLPPESLVGPNLYTQLLVAGVVGSVGVVLLDSISDVEIVDLARDEREVATNQATSRFVQVLGGFIAAVLSGYIAALGMPVLSKYKVVIAGVMALCGLYTAVMRRKELTPVTNIDTEKVVGLVGALVILSVILVTQGSSLAVLLSQTVLLGLLFGGLARKRSRQEAIGFITTLVGLYLLRVSPGTGPGATWWMTDPVAKGGLGFDEVALGHMRIVSGVADVAMLYLGTRLAHYNPAKLLIGIVAAWALIDIIPILIYYGHAPSYLLVADTAAVGALASATMIPLGILIARHAPVENRTMYLATTATLMNSALLASDVGTKYLVSLFPVERGQYAELGKLLFTSWLLFVIFGIVGLGLIGYNYGKLSEIKDK